ncbi:hypothetical protein [Tuberibacillus sp. Marseille-P3662]|uniref:hypothetical protein n=1 Tax=Tuberibacillus sp. Marseille-P3662 TaxID=1965358 RepID=UPI000A1CCCB4|nr:hypothetical protein [Tuberibacillus sp. Marseille-P3662]
MKRLLIWAFIIAAFPTVLAHAHFFGQASYFKVVMTTDEDEFRYEYQNPDTFEFVKNQTLMCGEKAERKVNQLYKNMQFDVEQNADELVKRLQSNGYEDIKTLKIWYRDSDDKLNTWVWKRDGGY